MPSLERIKNITPYPGINDVLCFLSSGISDISGTGLVGVYLTGSLSYGDFDEGRSDIDLAVVLEQAASPEQVASIKKLHAEAERKFKRWSKRIECSYIPREMLRNILPPESPRPYVGGGIFYDKIPYGNEWIINNYFLYNSAIALIGPEFKTLIDPIDIKDVQKACIRDLHKEWEPKITDHNSLDDSHLQSYVVLNLCRILYTVMRCDAVSKKVAASWVEEEYSQWRDLIGEADGWHYGAKMERQDEVIEFIKFVMAETEKGERI